MVISASRRTDIPAFYSEWFLNRVKEGFLLVPNPKNLKHLLRVDLSPEKIDCIVFWTKNPAPLMPALDILDEFNYLYYFEFTVNPYGNDMEKYVLPLEQNINLFKELSTRLKPERVDWRFDPVIIDERFTIDWHKRNFHNICSQIHKYTKRCIISFIDHYKHLPPELIKPKEDEIYKLAESFSETAKEFNLPLFACTEQIDLNQYGIEHASCIDKDKIEKLVGYFIGIKKDTGQRKMCGCIKSVDIGIYNTCSHGCRYCYATTSEETVLKQVKDHNPSSPLLIGFPNGTERITVPNSPKRKKNQKLLFD